MTHGISESQLGRTRPGSAQVTGALGPWLAAEAAPAGPERNANGVDPAGAAELEGLRAKLALTQARVRLQSDPAWLAELSPVEREAERQAAQKIRAAARDRQVAVAMAMGKLGGKEQRAENRLARLELSDRLWSRRAIARRMRLMDPTSRLASLHRSHVTFTSALAGVAAAGIAWTSIGVHDALVGPGGTPAAYLVEPIFSVPLLVIMGLAARAAQWGRSFPPPAKRTQVYSLEVFLLGATVAINSVSVLPRFGHWQGTAMLLAHLMPPVLIVVAVALQPLVAGFLGEILTDAHHATQSAPATGSPPEDPDAGGRARLDADTVDTLVMIAHVRAALTRGELREWDGTGLPSISAIQRHFHCEKRRAQAVHDALRILTTATTSTPLNSVNGGLR